MFDRGTVRLIIKYCTNIAQTRNAINLSGPTRSSFVSGIFLFWSTSNWSTINWHQKAHAFYQHDEAHRSEEGESSGMRGRGLAERTSCNAGEKAAARNKKAAKLRLLKESFSWIKRKPKVDHKPRIKNRTHLEYCLAMHAHGACTCFDHLLQQTPQSSRMSSPVVRASTPETPSAKHLRRTRNGVARQWGIHSDIHAFPERDASDPANDPCARCHHMECSADRCK